MDGQGTKWHKNIAENFNRLSRAHERYRRQTTDRQTTDGRTTTYSEHELEFTFAKKTLTLCTLQMNREIDIVNVEKTAFYRVAL